MSYFKKAILYEIIFFKKMDTDLFYIRNMTKTTKKNASKITTENKAIQTAQEEKIEIEADDLTSGMFEIFLSLLCSIYYAYFS